MFDQVRLAESALRVRLSAKIICNDRSSIFDCVVRSVSATSALLEMPNTLGVPKAFHLRIKPSNDERECQIAWRTETQIGVTFGFPSTTPGAVPPKTRVGTRAFERHGMASNDNSDQKRES